MEKRDWLERLEGRLSEALDRNSHALDPATVWIGHYGPVTGDVRRQLEEAAEGA